MKAWIQMEVDLHDHPKVRGIARHAGLSADAVIGKLLRVWSWFDAVSVDGVVDACVDADVDDLARLDGFAAAMMRVGWLVFDADLQQVRMPGFHVHQGNSAKKRLLKSARQSRYRSAKTKRNVDARVDASVDAAVDAGASTKASPRTRTRTREDQKKGEADASLGRQADRFGEWWAVYPNRVKKKTAREIWTRKHLDARADDLIADVVNRIANDGRWLDGFVPDPTTYLNQERWDDELTKGRARPNSTPSKTMQALTSLQDMKHGQQQPSFDLEPDAETGVPGPRRPAGR